MTFPVKVLPQKKIANVLETAKMCRGYGVNDAFISSIICRRNTFPGEKVKRVGFLFKQICQENKFIHIDSANNELEDLWQDGIHLLEYGKTKLAQNFTYFSNCFCWLSSYKNDLERDTNTHFGLTLSYSNSEVLHTKNCESTSTTAIPNNSRSDNETNALKKSRES